MYSIEQTQQTRPLVKLLTKFNPSFWSYLMPITKTFTLYTYYNLVYHPFTILLDADLIQTYKNNENGEYKLYLVFKKLSNYKVVNGVNLKKYIHKHFSLVEELPKYDVFSINYNTIDVGEDPFDINIGPYSNYCLRDSCSESQFILTNNLVHHIINNTQVACELLKLELGRSIPCHSLLKIVSDEQETYIQKNYLL